MVQAERTPNPNSLKFTALNGQFSKDGIVAISSSDETDRHPLGADLFAIDGVDDVFITPQFVTVSKEAGRDWDDLKETVETALTDFLKLQQGG